MENTSGQGKAAVLPAEIQGWNWGAFLVNWIWGLGNRTYIALLMFVPFVNMAMPFVLGFKGNGWAWRNKRWESVEQFKRVQRKWALAALVIYAALVAIVGIAIFAGMQAMKSSTAYIESVSLMQANEKAIEALGAPITAGSPSGSISTTGGKGKADLSYSAQGSKAKGTVYVDANEAAGAWKFDSIELQIEGKPDRINLLAKSGPAAAAAPAAGGGTTIGKIVIATSKDAKESDAAFKPDAGQIHAWAPLNGPVAGAKIKSVWVAVKVKDIAPETPAGTLELTLKGDESRVTFSMDKPDPAWPQGAYRVDLLVGDKVVGSGKFNVE